MKNFIISKKKLLEIEINSNILNQLTFQLNQNIIKARMEGSSSYTWEAYTIIEKDEDEITSIQPIDKTIIDMIITQLCKNGYNVKIFESKLDFTRVEISWKDNENTLQTTSIPSQAESLPSKTASIPSQAESIPSQAESLPSKTASLPSQAESLPSQAASLPSQAASLPSKTASIPSQAESLPSQAASLPSREEILEKLRIGMRIIRKKRKLLGLPPEPTYGVC